MEETEIEQLLFKLFDYFRIEHTDANNDDYLTLVNVAIEVEKIEKLYILLENLLPKLKAIKTDIDTYIKRNL